MSHGATAGIAIGAIAGAALIAAGAFFLGRRHMANKVAEANRASTAGEVKASYPSGRYAAGGEPIPHGTKVSEQPIYEAGDGRPRY